MSVSHFYAPPDVVASRARSATRDSRKQVSIPVVSGGAAEHAPRRAVRSISLDLMGVCRGWLDGSDLMRCKVEPGFQAIVGVGNDVKYAAGDPSTHGIPCDITTKKDKLQILDVIYDDKLRNLTDTDGNPTWGGFNYDDQMVFAPHVLMCEFADTDSDNVIESFTKSRPFHVDRRGKDHILSHDYSKGDMPEDTDA